MKIIAHRGGSDRFPPLSIPAARHSLSLGAFAVEIDVRTCADGTIVISHDEDARALFGSSARVDELTVAEWRALRYTDAPELNAPTLEQFLLADVGPLVLHVKAGAVDVDALLDVLGRHGYLDRVVLGLMSPDQVAHVRGYRGGVRGIEILGFMPRLDQLDDFARAGADIIRLWEPWVTAAQVHRVTAQGCHTWIMTGRPGDGSVGHTEQSNLAAWQILGVDGVLVDLVADATAVNPE